MHFIYGVNPVSEALKSGGSPITKIVIAHGRTGESIQAIIQMARMRKIPVEKCGREDLDRLIGRSSHQGIAGLCQSFSYANLADLISCADAKTDEAALILILDQVVDPQNLGSLIRTANCFGAEGVVIPENRAASVTAAVAKASAGAVNYTPVAKVVNLSRAIEDLKQHKFWIYGTEANVGQDIRHARYDRRIGLVLGSEGKGMRPSVKKQCDFLLSIPMQGQINSLNVAVAAGVIMYEVRRQQAS